MKVNSPMLKSVFLFTSKVLLLLSFAGCSKTLTNVTPDDAQRNPSNLYRFTTQCNIRMNKIIPETLKLSLVIDGEKFPLKAYLQHFRHQTPLLFAFQQEVLALHRERVS